MRQAIEAFLALDPQADSAAGEEIDSLCLVMLGRHLGPTTRLASTGFPTAAEQLTGWVDQTWGGSPSAARARAQATLRTVFRYWHVRGWLASEPDPGST